MESYASLRAALASHETSAFDQTFVNSLPSTASLNGVSNFYVPSAVAKALGFISPTSSIVDGAVGMGIQIPSNLLVGAALHELTHAMGREPGVGPFDLLRYTSPGHHLFSSGNTAVPAYFSIDGGTLSLPTSVRHQIQAISSTAACKVQKTHSMNITVAAQFKTSRPWIKNSWTPGFQLIAALVATVIESAGATSLTEIGNIFTLQQHWRRSLAQIRGADYVPGQFGARTPIGAEKTASGYEVAWKNMSTGQYSVWGTDNNGNYASNIVGVALGTSVALESIESSFHQDLNGDGTIGLPARTEVIDSDGVDQPDRDWQSL